MHRRQALGTLLGSALSVAGTASLAAPSSHSKRITLGFSTYGMHSLTTEQAIARLDEIGFDAVELTVWPEFDAAPGKLNQQRRQKLKRELQNRGMSLSALMEQIEPTNDPAKQKRNENRLQASLDLAVDLGAPIVETTLGGGKWDERKGLYRERLGRWLELAGSRGVTLAVKPHRGGGMSRPEEAVWLIEQLRRPQHLRMVYDYSHYDFRGMTLEDTLTTALPWTAFVAVKDVVREGEKVRFALPGESGRIDYVALLAQLKRGGYAGDINCEVSGQIWRQPGYDAIAAAKTCYANLAPAFETAGISR